MTDMIKVVQIGISKLQNSGEVLECDETSAPPHRVASAPGNHDARGLHQLLTCPDEPAFRQNSCRPYLSPLARPTHRA